MIKGLKTVLGYGVLVWAIPFVVAFILFPIRNSDRVFFESIMPVVVVVVMVLLARQLRGKDLLRSWQTGLLWLVVCVVLDQLFFTWGPQKISFTDYWKDIGFIYLLLPIITWAMLSAPKTAAAHEVIGITPNIPESNP